LTLSAAAARLAAVRVLAVETSTLTGAAALLEGDTVVAECRLSVALTHSERLLPAVDHLLRTAGRLLAAGDALAVAVRPGSFTGLRIGVSTMKSLAYATGKPLVGVPTLDALAWTLPFATHPVCPILDAKKGEVYAALYRTGGGRLERLWDYQAVAPERLAAGRGGPARRWFPGARAPPRPRPRPPRPAAGARGGPPRATGRRWAPPAAGRGRAPLGGGESPAPAALTPLYLRRSEAELGRERR